MGLQTGSGKLVLPIYVAYEIIKNTILPSNFTDAYAQEKKDCSKADSKWEGKSRTEKIDYLHSTNNRIMPLVQTDSTGALEDIITGLQNGVSLFTPTTINVDLNYGDEIALDLTNFPMRKPYATQTFKGVSFDEAFNFFYNSIDKSYTSEKKVVINKCQATKNHEEIETALRIFESKDPKWAEYIKDGKLSAEEFKNLDRNVNVVEITSHDKNGKAIERGYAFINRRHDNTGKVKLVEKEVPVPYPVEVPVIEYRDTCITPPTEPPKDPSIELGIGPGVIHEGNNKRYVPQGRVALTLHDAVFGADMELGAYGGYRKFKESQDNIEFEGPHGLTTVYPTLDKEIYNAGGDVLFGGDVLKIGVGANHYTITSILKQKFDEILRDHAGNIVKERHDISLPDGNKEVMNCWRYGPRVGLRAGDFEVIGLADFSKHDKPSYGIDLIYHFFRK